MPQMQWHSITHTVMGMFFKAMNYSCHLACATCIWPCQGNLVPSWWGCLAPAPSAAGTVLRWPGGARRPNHLFQLHRLHGGEFTWGANYFSFILSVHRNNSMDGQWLTCMGMPRNHCWLSLSRPFLLLIYSLFRKHSRLTEVPLGLLAGF